MISVALAGNRGNNLPSTVDKDSIPAGKKRLFIIVVSLILLNLATLGVLVNKRLNKTVPRQHFEAICPASSHTVVSEPALTMTFAVHFSKTRRWPILAAVSAVLVVGVDFAVFMRYSSEPEIPEVEVEEPVIVVEEEPNFFTTPLGIGSLVAAAAVISFIAFGIGKLIQRAKEGQREEEERAPVADMITASTFIDDMFPIWNCEGGSEEKAVRQLIILSLLARKIDDFVDKQTNRSIGKMADPKNPRFPWSFILNAVYDDLDNGKPDNFINIGDIALWAYHGHQDDPIRSLANKMIAKLATVEEAERPKKSDFKRANDRMHEIGLDSIVICKDDNILAYRVALQKWAEEKLKQLEDFNF